MQQLLVDALTGDRVILAPGRGKRPDTFRVDASPLPPNVATCPFCAGNEAETPPEVARTGAGAPNTPGWDVRVVPNKYPIVGDGVNGVHEVVILSPAHDADLGDLSEARSVSPLLMLRDRAHFHLQHGLTYAQPFVNAGKTAGASIEHPHAQLVALDGVPPRVEALLAHFDDASFADDREYVIEKDADVEVWCPRAAISPFFTRLALRDAGPRFDEANDDEIRAIGGALHRLVARFHHLLGRPDYNIVIVTAPRGHVGRFRWWVEARPRLTVMAGFEFGTGVWVNVVLPADAAHALRAS